MNPSSRPTRPASTLTRVDVTDLLRAEREARGLSQQQLADASGLSRSIIARLESGACSPTWRSVERYLAGLGPRARVEVEDIRETAELAAAQVAALTPEQRAHQLPGVWHAFLDRFQTAHLECAVVGRSAALLLGLPGPLPPNMELEVAAPDGRRNDVVRVLRGLAAMGQDPRWRDHRHTPSLGALRVVERWRTVYGPLELRLVNELRAVTRLRIADRDVPVVPTTFVGHDHSRAPIDGAPPAREGLWDE